MGTLSPCIAIGAVLIAVAQVCHGSPSVPVATDPILSTATVSTVLPSLLTIYSVVPATDSPGALQTVTTTVDGAETVLTTSGGVVTGFVTSTIISTILLSTTEVVVNTVGVSTILGPDPIVTSTGPAPATTAAETAPVTTPAATNTASETFSSTSFAVVVASSASTASTYLESSALIASTSASTSSTTPVSSGSPASVSSSPPPPPSSPSPSKGLSTGAKAGIGIGVAFAVILLVLVAFFFGRRFLRRRNINVNAACDSSNLPAVQESDFFRAGIPYEHTRSQQNSRGASTGKGYPYSETTEAASESSQRSREAVGMRSPNKQAESADISALPEVMDNEPMYIGVPSHMSGSKRWSMKEYEK